MAFLRATILPGGYVNVSDANGTPIAIQITGEIVDDAIAGVLVDTYVLEGVDFAGLPAVNPATDGTPQDARYQAIKSLTAAHVKAAHAAWVATVAATAVEAAKTAAQTAQMPPITPADLPP